MKDWPETDAAQAGIRFTGAVYTPRSVADAIVDHCASILGSRPVEVLEPSAGDGVFARALDASGISVSNLTAVDIDDQAIVALKHSCVSLRYPVTLHAGDFISYALRNRRKRRPELILGNPPFIRRHNYSDEFKLQCTALAEYCDFPEKGLKNAWTAFLFAAKMRLSATGILALVLPYEILTVEYGQRALQDFQNSFARVDVFISSEKAFPEIDQDAVVLVAQRSTHQEHGTFFKKLENFDYLHSSNARKIQFENNEAKGLEFSSFLLDDSILCRLRKLRERCPTIADYATSAPGLVTAANDFFIRNSEDIQALGLQDFAKPVLKRGGYAPSRPTYRKKDHSRLEQHEPSHFLHFTGPFEDLPIAARSYIKRGENLDLHKRYKCRKRTNWYEVPLIEAKAGIFFKRCHSHPRVVINEAQILTTDSAYGITPFDGYSIRSLCFSFYNSLTMLFAETDGRFYGGGVLELSPTEFRGLPLVYKEPTQEEFSEFLRVHREAKGDPRPILDFGDKWLGEALDLCSTDLKNIRAGWTMVRAHRLRHGGRQSET